MLSYVKFIIRYRIIVSCIILLLTVLSLVSISRGVLSSSVGNLFLGESPKYEDYLARVDKFSSDELIIIGFEEPRLLSTRSIKRLQGVVAKLKKHPEIGRVHSLIDAQHVEIVDGTPKPESYI